MKQIIISLIFIFCFVLLIKIEVQAQFIKMANWALIGAYVLDENTSKPIVYANVYVKQTRIGTITDTAGYFLLRVKVHDTITFSSLGYKKKYFIINDSVRDNKKPAIIYLKQNIVELKAVEVFAMRRYKQLEYDIKNMKLKDDDFTNAQNNFPTLPNDLIQHDSKNKIGFGVVIHPITALYDAFSKEGKEKQKILLVREKDERDSLLNSKINLNNLATLLGYTREELNLFIIWCDFNYDFISHLTDYELISVVRYKKNQYDRIINKN